MSECVRDRRALPSFPNGLKIVLFIDSCGGHSLAETFLEALKVRKTQKFYSFGQMRLIFSSLQTCS